MSTSYRSSRRKGLTRYDSKRQSAYLPSSPKDQDDCSGSSRLESSETDLELRALDKDEPILSGKIVSIPKRKASLNMADRVLPTSIVRESFHRRAGIRELMDASGAYKLRTVEIKRKHNESVGFYIQQGDGWQRSNGIFVSRVNLGSVVDINDLLHIGDEIVKVNGIDVSGYPLNDVVSLIKKKRNTLRLTVKLPTSQAILRTFSKKQDHEIEQPPLQEKDSNHETLAAIDLLSEIAIHLESTPEFSRPQQPLKLLETGSESGQDAMVSTPEQTTATKREASPLKNSMSTAQDHMKGSTGDLSPPMHKDTNTSDNESQLSSSPPPSPPTSPIPDMQDSPLLFPQQHKSTTNSLDEMSSSSSDYELTDSLKDLLSPLEKFPPSEKEYHSSSHNVQVASINLDSFQSGSSSPTQCKTSLPSSHPPTPPTSLPPTPPTSLPPTPPSLLPPTPPASLPPSHPPTPTNSPPPSPDSSPPPLPKSPPPLLAYEPLTPDTSDHLSPPTTKPRIPSDSDNEDIFNLKEIKDHLRHWLTHYEASGTDQQTSI